MLDIVTAIILGVVEGITEFLPVSSTGHLILVNSVIGFSEEFSNLFNIVIQLGAILAVVIYFRKKILPVYKKSPVYTPTQIIHIWKKVLIAVVPALLIGALAGDYVEERLFHPITVAIALTIGGIALIIIEQRNKQAKIFSVAEMSYKMVLLIGLIQCLALIPGTSRSAATIIGALLLGVARPIAAEFSFFLAIPTLFAASAYSLLKYHSAITTHEMLLLAVGCIVSFIVAWVVISGFMQYISKHSFKAFGYYRIILGIGILLFYFI